MEPRPVNIASPKKVVLLGMMSKCPVGGVIWQTLHYLIGFRQLGFETYYVEAHGITPTKLMVGDDLDGSVAAAEFIHRVLNRFGFGDAWAFHALHSDGKLYGMSSGRLQDLYSSATLIINLHGATVARPEHAATNRLVYLETDPVAVQILVHQKFKDTLDYLAPHCAFYTFGENYGQPDCRLPVSSQFQFKPTRQPVLPELWEPYGVGPAELFTTIGNWRQTGMGKEVQFNGQTYHWSKHLEFEKFIDLPSRVSQPFELALSSSSYRAADKARLESKGWKVRDSLAFSSELDPYRDYIGQSRAEFTVAKQQNIELRSGWFSDRAATYLAAGRPVVTQETGFSKIFPTGAGLFAFSTMDEIVAAVEAINCDYPRHRRAALTIAREYFTPDVVLGQILDDLGVTRPKAGLRRRGELRAVSPAPDRSEQPAVNAFIPPELVLTPISRLPMRLCEATVQTAMALPVPTGSFSLDAASDPRHGEGRFASQLPPEARMNDAAASIIVVTHNGLPFTRLCLASLFTGGWNRRDELIIVDNGSSDETPEFLRQLAQANPAVRVICNRENRGFAAANNQALAAASGDVLILLNNDTLVTPGWRDALVRWLDDSAVGLVGPVTNRICNAAQIDAPYDTYSEMVQFARDYTARHLGQGNDIRMLALFCAALRRDVYERIGGLDEQFGIGLFEDEDYSLQLQQAGYRVVCAEDVFVHHFSQAAFGELCATGEFDRLLSENRRRLEAKWGFTWKPHPRRITPEYERLREKIREIASTRLPAGSTVMVVSKGDEELLNLQGRRAWHFPQSRDGSYPHIYPATSAEAIDHLETLRGQGAGYFLIPKPAFWWLDHYADFRAHLERRYPATVRDAETCLVFDLGGGHV